MRYFIDEIPFKNDEKYQYEEKSSFVISEFKDFGVEDNIDQDKNNEDAFMMVHSFDKRNENIFVPLNMNTNSDFSKTTNTLPTTPKQMHSTSVKRRHKRNIFSKFENGHISASSNDNPNEGTLKISC